MKIFCFAATFSALFFLPTPVWAEGGELTVRVTTSQAAAFVRRDTQGATVLSAANGYLPRLGTQVVYGFTHAFQAGLSIEASFSRPFSSDVINYQNVAKGRITRSYQDLLIGLPLEVRRPRGALWTLWAEFIPGVAIAHTDDLSLVSGHPPRAIVFNKQETHPVGLSGQGRLGIEWRFNTSLQSRFGIEVGRTGNRLLYGALFFSFDYIRPLGPHL